MKPLEDELHNLLRRKEPPEGFAERVAARLATKKRQSTELQRIFPLFGRPVLRWVAVAAACAITILSFVRYEHQQRMRAEAERASQEAIFRLADCERRTQHSLAASAAGYGAGAEQSPKNKISNGVTYENTCESVPEVEAHCPAFCDAACGRCINRRERPCAECQTRIEPTR